MTIFSPEATFVRPKRYWSKTAQAEGPLCANISVLTFFAADTWLRIRAVETVREILSDPAVHIIPQSHESFLSGFDLYAAVLTRATASRIVFQCKPCAVRD